MPKGVYPRNNKSKVQKTDSAEPAKKAKRGYTRKAAGAAQGADPVGAAPAQDGEGRIAAVATNHHYGMQTLGTYFNVLGNYLYDLGKLGTHATEGLQEHINKAMENTLTRMEKLAEGLVPLIVPSVSASEVKKHTAEVEKGDEDPKDVIVEEKPSKAAKAAQAAVAAPVPHLHAAPVPVPVPVPVPFNGTT